MKIRRPKILTVCWMAMMLSLLPSLHVGAQDAAAPKSRVALKTNLLYDVVLVPNAGVEVSLGRQWTVGADGFFTWFSSDSRHRYWQGYGGYLTLRRYFGTPVEGQSICLKAITSVHTLWA